eukprot:7353163-Prorocentrum_lima.AAC.1
MTSSLVGSEMCIRDSYFAAGKEKVELQWSVPGSETILEGGQKQAYPEYCLLYTSDAADDM